MVGRTLNHYRILEPLGSGGMGQVWLAQDEKLHRRVALKILPPSVAASQERRSRFEREARAVAALNHPNIVTIYSVEEAGGIHFITMELVAGRTLTASIPPSGMELPRLLDAALPLTEAVGAAHELGIVHRDIKPDNVVMSERGVLKVLDFGLAKLHDDAPQDITSAPTTLVTAEGRIVGTVAYMSPEQAEGKPIDARSDVFSLGVTLYQMATGKRPFAGETSLSTLTAILRDTPPPVTAVNPSLPGDLQRIIKRCLEKSPGDRFASAQSLRAELGRLKEESLSGGRLERPAAVGAGGADKRVRRTVLVALGVAALLLAITVGRVVFLSGRQPPLIPAPPGAAQAPPVPMPPAAGASIPAKGRVVVLPFKNLGHAEDAYFAAGVTEEITSRLAGVAGLAVISSTSALRYADSGMTIGRIGQELGVSHVLEGTVRWDKGASDAGRVRVTPRLIRVADDTQVWTEAYDRSMEGIFEVQSEIASEVVEQLGVSLGTGAQESIASLPTRNMEAYKEYLKGKGFIDASLVPDSMKAVEHLRKAVDLDPKFAVAWAKLAEANTYVYHTGMDRTEERLVVARKAADKALALAGDLPEPTVALGYYYYWGRRDYDQALATFEKAAAGRPPRSDVLAAVSYIKRRQGRWDESLEGLEAALQLDPASAELLFNLWDSYIFTRRFDKAEALCPRFGQLGAEALALCKARITASRGRLEEALAFLPSKVKPESPVTPTVGWFLNTSLGRHEEALGWAKLAKEELDETSFPPRSLLMAWSNVYLHKPEEARRSFEKVVAAMNERLKRAQDPEARQYLSQAYAGLGRKEEALREATLAVDMVSMTRDARDGPQFLGNLAEVYALAGDEERALDLIDQVLTVPSEYTVPLVETHRVFAGLRDNPRFEEILRKHRQPQGR